VLVWKYPVIVGREILTIVLSSFHIKDAKTTLERIRT